MLTNERDNLNVLYEQVSRDESHCSTLISSFRRRKNCNELVMIFSKTLKPRKFLSLPNRFSAKWRTNATPVCFSSHLSLSDFDLSLQPSSKLVQSPTNAIRFVNVCEYCLVLFYSLAHRLSRIQIATDTGLNERARYEQRIEDLEVGLRKVRGRFSPSSFYSFVVCSSITIEKI